MSDDSKGVFASVRSELNFPADEAEILSFWQEGSIFDKTLRAATRSTGPSKGPFVFYEGPPTANGMPHNGHALTRSIKDVVPRYKTMCGYDVPRQGGWDTHGLPVEVEVEKELGIHGKADIIDYGMEPFIARCIESVFRYTEAWEHNTQKIGYWIDTEGAYVTYHRSYVESVWWALSELHRKKLLYRGHRVCWWWPQGGTALSAAEVGWNYKTVDDPSVFVALALEDEPEVSLCVWTTTPWTLPSNGYAAVKGNIDYVRCGYGEGKELIVAEALREALAKKFDCELPVISRLKGSDLIGKRYRPCFDTFSELYDQTAALKQGGTMPLYWRVIEADFVTLDAGTGIVHVAPAFGEDDNLAHKAQLKTYAKPDDVPLICAVQPDGKMTEQAGAFAGMWVKDADRPILEDLKQRECLVHAEQYRHEYPYCWRADKDPLIQLARPAWYIRTTDRIDDAIRNNQQINWLPEHIKDGRFGDFLANNVDWALSRERFWGTPLNVWVCEGCGAEFCPASVAEIEARNADAFAHFHEAKKKDPSLNEHLIVHKPWIDQVTLPCADCDQTMGRVPEVIDAWFDSGCMPFAQLGFPHRDGSLDAFGQAWPADFISEAIDQTRGWFYSLLMISTMLFDEQTCERVGLPVREYPHPYRSCVVLGHVCDREGKKESKSKGNYTPPDIILERVRMEFAVVPAGDDRIAHLHGKFEAQAGVAYVARVDYEGLDLQGESTKVLMYRGDQEDAASELELRPFGSSKQGAGASLPRRVVVMAPEDVDRFKVTSSEQALTVKPFDVPRLAATERIFIEDLSRPAPGADAFRWFFYASSPPWTNTRHSLSNVRLLQKDFIIKLRNVYSFFVIYANIDGFSPAEGNEAAVDTTVEQLSASASYRPGEERSELDRWMLSELALTTREVASRLDRFDLYGAAQRIVELVDALSNWYVRRSRNRFWASVDDEAMVRDKLDATYTLYEVLVTTAKMIAPFVPFFAEELYQNLVRGPWPNTQPESVHLCAFPQPDAAVMDEKLAAEMKSIRELVSLGLQVRTDNKLRVRQPLSRADIIVASAEQLEGLRAYAELVQEELNVHEVRWLLPGEERGAVAYQLKPNFRALGPRLGKKVQLVKKALAGADAGALRNELASTSEIALDIGDETVVLTDQEVQIAVVASEGFAAAGGGVGVVVLHTALDQDLLDEGLAREVLAKVQGERKRLDLGYTDRIDLTVQGSDRVQQVVEKHREHIMAEALCSAITIGALLEGEDSEEVQGESLRIVANPS